MSILKHLREFIRARGFDICRYVPETNRPFDILPYIIKDRISKEKDFFIVQVGANDGILDDPIRDSICQYHLQGLLIEPLPDLFDKLKANYSEEKQLLFENIAILPNDGEVKLFRVRADASVPKHWHGIASFNKNNLLAQGVRESHIEQVSAKGTSLKSLTAKYNIKKISLLQIDTEGYDFEVIKSAFNSGIYPDMINYEHCWLPPLVRYNCKIALQDHGYKYVEVGKDTLAIRQQFVSDDSPHC